MQLFKTFHIASSLLQIVLPYSFHREKTGYPELLESDCIACLALRPRGGYLLLAIIDVSSVAFRSFDGVSPPE